LTCLSQWAIIDVWRFNTSEYVNSTWISSDTTSDFPEEFSCVCVCVSTCLKYCLCSMGQYGYIKTRKNTKIFRIPMNSCRKTLKMSLVRHHTRVTVIHCQSNQSIESTHRHIYRWLLLLVLFDSIRFDLCPQQHEQQDKCADEYSQDNQPWKMWASFLSR
jgi:hypothetical protein